MQKGIQNLVHKTLTCHLKKAIEKIKPYTHSRHARHMVLWAVKAYEGKRQAAGAPEVPQQQKGWTKYSSHVWLLGFKLNTIKSTAALVSSHISNAHSHTSYINYGMCLPLHRVLHNRDVPEWSGKAVLGGYLLSCEKRPKGNQGSEDSIFEELPAGRHRKHKSTTPGHRGKVTRAETKPKHTGPVGVGIRRAVAPRQEGGRVAVLWTAIKEHKDAAGAQLRGLCGRPRQGEGCAYEAFLAVETVNIC